MTTYGEFGNVTIHDTVVAVSGTSDQLCAWTQRPGNSWPCSTLERYDLVVAWFDRGGLANLEGRRYFLEGTDEEYETESIDGGELNAWSSDVLRDVLPRDHPAYFPAVGQFEQVDLGTCE